MVNETGRRVNLNSPLTIFVKVNARRSVVNLNSVNLNGVNLNRIGFSVNLNRSVDFVNLTELMDNGALTLPGGLGRRESK